MLARVIERVSILHPSIVFDLVVPNHARDSSNFGRAYDHEEYQVA